MSEAQLAALTPADRFIQERASSLARAEGLNNTPVYIHHGDADPAVNVEVSRWAAKVLQRWGYDVRYHEYPGRAHETLRTSSSNVNASIPWFLKHRRDAAPRQVRIRTPELRHAKSWWVDVRQVASPMEFADVDAEVIDHNVIRLDTRNVLEVVLTPGPALIDSDRPVRVIWNGAASELRPVDGAMRLADPAYRPATLVKTAALPGTLADFTATPFAVVIGTRARDPAMAQALRDKANAFVDQWRTWQKYPPRIFLDTEIPAADIAKYSLLLFGGAADNRVTAGFGSKLPLRVTKNAVIVNGHEFPTASAVVQMIYPNPRNPQRYVWVVAANDSAVLFGAETSPENIPEWDFVIQDGRMPAHGQVATRTQTAIASGHFDYNWRYAPALVVNGDAAARARANQVHSPRATDLLAPDALDLYVGKYLIANGFVVEVRREGSKLVAQAGNDSGEMLPQAKDNFFMPAFGVWIAFQRDAAGKISGFTSAGGDNDFEGKRQE
jgi:hypothetical protein